jgi:hypothetical protein
LQTVGHLTSSIAHDFSNLLAIIVGYTEMADELADVLSAIISRIRGASHAVPLVAAYDDHERVWLPPAPVLFQRRTGAGDRAIPAATIRKILTAALARTGLTGPGGGLLHYTPHDFRRMFLTDAKMGRIASDASFRGSCERALPEPPHTALRGAHSEGTAGQRGDLGCRQRVATNARMFHLLWLR